VVCGHASRANKRPPRHGKGAAAMRASFVTVHRGLLTGPGHTTILVLGCVLLQVAVSAAQMTTINPSSGPEGLSTQVTQFGQRYDITGGTPSGGNMFHSLALFNVGRTNGVNDVANFTNTNGLVVRNIISRVTDGPSNISGAIQTSNYPGANLFLVNPAGIVFGPSASITVPGSVHASS